MAINYWEQVGRPTNYNPMPTGWGNFINTSVIAGMDMRITFRAKSATNALLTVTDTGGANISKQFALTTEFKEYEFTWYQPLNNIFALYDQASAGNIIIENIKLVEKPTGRTTINGIDGFLSGKWNSIHANAKIIDDSTLELNAVGDYQASYIEIPMTPNTPIIAWHENLGGKIYIREYDAAGASINQPAGHSVSVALVTKPNTAKVRISLDNGSANNGKIIFKKPMLNMGDFPVPYEPKRGERMVLPVPVKNVFDNSMVNIAVGIIKIPTGFKTTGYANNGANFLKLKPNTTYTFTGKVNVTKGAGTASFGRLSLTDGTNWMHINPGAVKGDLSNTFTTPADIDKYTQFYVYGSSTAGEELEITEIQIVEGIAKYPYEPYRAQMARKANLIPKKNLLPQPKGSVTNSGVTMTCNDDGSFTFNGTNIATGVAFNMSSPALKTSGGFQSSGDAFNLGRFISGQHTLSVNVISGTSSNPANTFFGVSSAGGVSIPGVAGLTLSTVKETSGNANGVLDYAWIYLGTGVTLDNLRVTLQLEEGAAKTEHKPFKLAPRKADRTRPKKNIFSVSHLVSQLWTQASINAMFKEYDLKPNTAYTISSNVPVTGTANLYFNGTGTAGYGVFNDTPRTMTTGANGKLYVAIPNTPYREYTAGLLDGTYYIQLEEGTTATPYEPYKLIGRPARRGLEFNGINDRMTVTTPLATLGNKNFEIEGVFNYNPLNPGGAQQQSILSCGDIRFGISSTSADTIGFYTPATGWVNAIYYGGSIAPIDFDIPLKLKAIITPTKAQVFLNDVLTTEKDYSGVINATPQTMLHIGAFGGAQYFYSGSLLSLKMISEGSLIFDFDFTKPSRNLGATFKSNGGTNGVIIGNPLQLNRQARR